jgi:hypothetical protein
VHKVLSGRLKSIREIFGTVPGTLEYVRVLMALGDGGGEAPAQPRSTRTGPCQISQLVTRNLTVGISMA